MPKPLGYKHIVKRKNEVVFTNLAIRKKQGNILFSLSKKMQERFQVESLKVEEAKTLPLPEGVTLQQIRIQFDHVQKDWYMLIIYTVEQKKKSTYKNIMAIDLGLDNLAAITFRSQGWLTPDIVGIVELM